MSRRAFDVASLILVTGTLLLLHAGDAPEASEGNEPARANRRSAPWRYNFSGTAEQRCPGPPVLGDSIAVTQGGSMVEPTEGIHELLVGREALLQAEVRLPENCRGTALLWTAQAGTQRGQADLKAPSAANTVVVLPQVGLYDIALAIENEAGRVSAVVRLRATPVQPVPVAVLDRPIGPPQMEFDFDGSLSTSDEPCLPLRSHVWTFLSDDEELGSASGSRVSYQFPSPGSFTASLTVEDGCGQRAIDAIPVVVRATRPMVAMIVADPPAGPPGPFRFEAFSMTDSHCGPSLTVGTLAISKPVPLGQR